MGDLLVLRESTSFAAAAHGWARGTARRAGRGGRAGAGAGGTAHSLASEKRLVAAKQRGEGEEEAGEPGFLWRRRRSGRCGLPGVLRGNGPRRRATTGGDQSFSVKKLKRYITYYGQSTAGLLEKADLVAHVHKFATVSARRAKPAAGRETGLDAFLRDRQRNLQHAMQKKFGRRPKDPNNPMGDWGECRRPSRLWFRACCDRPSRSSRPRTTPGCRSTSRRRGSRAGTSRETGPSMDALTTRRPPSRT